MGWTVAWKRPIQLFAAMAETRMAFWLWQRVWKRFREMALELPV
jgi:uncharacterized membrane protein